MSDSKIDRRTDTGAKEDDELITRAAKRTDWAGAALASAAEDLGDAHGDEGSALTGLAEVIQEEATRVSHLAEDIESHRPVLGDGKPTTGRRTPSKQVSGTPGEPADRPLGLT